MSSRNDDEAINSQIDNLKKNGIEFHYDRNERIRRAALRQPEKSFKMPKKTTTILLFLIILIAGAGIFLSKNAAKGKTLIKGEGCYLEIVRINNSFETILDIKIHALNNDLVLTPGTTIDIDFYNNGGSVTKKTITVSTPTTIAVDKPIRHLLPVDRPHVFRSLGYRVTCKELQIEKEIRLR